MKHILCFGDSNTYGTNPSGGRWSLEVRWTGKIQRILGDEYRIIEEGCGGRTTVWEDNLEQHRCGRAVLPVLLSSHSPLDLVIIMLGTNDLKARFSLLPFDVAKGAAELARIVRSHEYGSGCKVPKILLVSPIHIGERIEYTGCFGMNVKSAEKSKRLFTEFERQSKMIDCALFNAADVARPSDTDNLHMDEENHTILAKALALKIRELFK